MSWHKHRSNVTVSAAGGRVCGRHELVWHLSTGGQVLSPLLLPSSLFYPSSLLSPSLFPPSLPVSFFTQFEIKKKDLDLLDMFKFKCSIQMLVSFTNILFSVTYLCGVCVYKCSVLADMEEGRSCPRSGVMGSCEPANVGPGKSSKGP